MAMGKRTSEQAPIWVAAAELPVSPSHPFYARLNAILDEAGFDRFAEAQCREFDAPTMGRPSLPPGRYFRLLLVGYFEGLDSERGIAWRAADSLGVRSLVGLGVDMAAPDHSTISRTRRRIALETHRAVFTWVQARLTAAGWLTGRTVAIDATTLEANAAMRSIVRRDTGETYQEFLTRLAAESGLKTPTREALARLDRRRKKRTSNTDWTNPFDPDAKITKMKDGRTHLAHKQEHAVDMDTGAVVAVTLQGATEGDTSTIEGTLEAAEQNLDDARKNAGDDSGMVEEPENVVADKGYHSKAVILALTLAGWRTYVAEPRRGRQHWDGQQAERDAVYANRARKDGERGKGLMRLRGELIERSFAHTLDTGGMRRTHLRHHDNIAKRVLIHVAGFNLGLLMRNRFGVGKPRCLQGLAVALASFVIALLGALAGIRRRLVRMTVATSQRLPTLLANQPLTWLRAGNALSTGC
jgi:transposase